MMLSTKQQLAQCLEDAIQERIKTDQEHDQRLNALEQKVEYCLQRIKGYDAYTKAN